MLPLLCLTELLPPFISQKFRDGTPQVQIYIIDARCKHEDYISVFITKEGVKNYRILGCMLTKAVCV